MTPSGSERSISIALASAPVRSCFSQPWPARPAACAWGTAISLLPFENPLRKAEDFAMLDILSGGRLNFGVGRGRSSPSTSRASARTCAKAECVTKSPCKSSAGLDPGPLRVRGKFWQVPSLSLSPKPLQKPHPPIYRRHHQPGVIRGRAGAGEKVFVVPWLTGPYPEVRAWLERYRTLVREYGRYTAGCRRWAGGSPPSCTR